MNEVGSFKFSASKKFFSGVVAIVLFLFLFLFSFFSVYFYPGKSLVRFFVNYFPL